jgi:transposase, IS5 family
VHDEDCPAQLAFGARTCFKRAYGAARCTWRGLDHFKAYIWSAAVAHNLVLLARLKPA